MFKSLIKAAISTAMLPVSLAIDVTTMGVSCMTNDECELLTVKNVKNISKHVEELLK